MPAQGKCPNTDCEGNNDIHAALKQNIDRHTGAAEKKILRCPFCSEEISSRFTICPHCSHIVLGDVTMKKSYLFVAVCIILIGLSLILKSLVK
jgi:hypothetical protein